MAHRASAFIPRLILAGLAVLVVAADVSAQQTAHLVALTAPGPDPFAGPWSNWPTLTGDWLGLRSDLAAHGITFNLSWTEFSQGVASGGRQNVWANGGHGDYYLNVDGDKAGLWKGLFINIHGETRAGQDVNGSTGALLPANLAMGLPVSNQDLTALTALKFTQALSENFIVFLGKINTIDDGLQLAFGGGNGTDGFMNSALLNNSATARTVPYSTYGAGFAILKDLQQVFLFMVLDPENRPTTGPSNLFERGVVLNGQGMVPIKPFGLPGHQVLGGVWSSATYAALDPGSYFIFPAPMPGAVSPTKSGSWALYYAFDQYLWVDSSNPKRGWGVFGQAGVSDGNPNPVQTYASLGIGGNGIVPSRVKDSFGAGYFFTGASDDFKNLFSNPTIGQRNGQGVELYYNVAITPWCLLTADLQVIQPGAQAFSPAVVPGVRLKFVF
jgi:porin